MTVIVGLIDKKIITMGADSASIAGWRSSKLKASKVFRLGNMLIGCAGEPRNAQLIKYGFTIPEHPDSMDAFEYLVTRFVEAMRGLFTNSGTATHDNKKESVNTFFLIGYMGRLFQIQSDYQVNESIYPYSAIGSGDELALGSLHTTENYDIKPSARVELAIKAAAEFNIGVSLPYTIMELRS